MHGLDYAKVAVNADSHHGQDGAIHVGVEDQGHETIWGYNKEEWEKNQEWLEVFLSTFF